MTVCVPLLKPLVIKPGSFVSVKVCEPNKLDFILHCYGFYLIDKTKAIYVYVNGAYTHLCFKQY